MVALICVLTICTIVIATCSKVMIYIIEKIENK